MFRRRSGPRPPRHTVARPWIDLLDPDPAAVAEAQAACGVRLPTRAELSEVESSSRRRREGAALYLSAVLPTDEREPQLSPVGFILLPARLITIRYAASHAFDTARAAVADTPPAGALEIFTTLVEDIVDGLADRLEVCGAELETLSRETFHGDGPRRGAGVGERLRRTLEPVGRNGERLSKTRAGLLTLARLVAYVAETEGLADLRAVAPRLGSLREDLTSLTNYEETLFNKTQFLLDAVLGFISIDQNDVIKVLTVVSVVGVPPTLIASIYGMNFKIIPELGWSFGYPYALALIALSAVAPLVWFKRRGWF